jgi:hypothetical protein
MMKRIEYPLPTFLANHQGTALKITRLQRLKVQKAARCRIGIEQYLEAPVETISLRSDLCGNAASRMIIRLQQQPFYSGFL